MRGTPRSHPRAAAGTPPGGGREGARQGKMDGVGRNSAAWVAPTCVWRHFSCWRSGHCGENGRLSLPPVPPGDVRDGNGAPSALVAALVHHVHGLLDAEQAARECRVHHLDESLTALALDVVDRNPDKVFGVLVPVRQLPEVRGILTGDLAGVALDAGLEENGAEPARR